MGSHTTAGKHAGLAFCAEPHHGNEGACQYGTYSEVKCVLLSDDDLIEGKTYRLPTNVQLRKLAVGALFK